MGWRNIISVGFLSAVVVFCSWQAAYAAVDLGVKAFQRGKCEEALKHPEPAANAGNAQTLYVLRQMYGSGRSVKKDEKKAAEFFMKTAELGNPGGSKAWAPP